MQRFHRTLGDSWADARYYDSTHARDTRLPAWPHLYNRHRAHSALGGRPQVTRLINLP
ncbi:transposase [Dietzia natronolimnaea]|nr:transposase [Dietzia natronolimnaea]